MRTLTPLVIAFVPTLTAPAHAWQAQLETTEVKRARPLPVLPDVKTPAPAFVTTPTESSIAFSEEAPLASPRMDTKRQAPSVVAPRRMGAQIERVHVDALAEEGAVWVRGRAYKARFGSDGVSYVPFFGSEAPANYPTRFTLRSARVGDQVIAFDASAGAQHESDSIRYSRGGLIERWDLALEQVEQRFEFDVLPAGGDLVLEIALDSTLAAAESDGGIAFSNELGRVEYSAAVAIDADGRRFAMHTTLVDGSIELRLASSALAGARLPLVIDPVVTTFAVTQTLNNDIAPDVAYEYFNDRYAVVVEGVFSATDHDVWVHIRDGSGASVATNSIDISSTYWAAPRVASNSVAGGYLCVAAVGLPSTAQRIIQGRMINPSSLVGSIITIAGADSFDKFAPDVGGDGVLMDPTFFCVVWERTYTATDHDVHARLVTSGGVATGPTIHIDNSGSTLDTRPAISKSDGWGPYQTQEWTVVWQRWYAPGMHQLIYGAQVHWDGVITHPTFPIQASSNVVRNPRVSSLLDQTPVGRPYLVVFEALNPTSLQWDVNGLVFFGPTFTAGVGISSQVGNALLHQGNPCAEADRRHFVVAYNELINEQNSDYDIVVADFLYADNALYLCDAQAVAATAFPEDHPSITSNTSGGGYDERYMLVWDKNNYQVGNRQAWGALYDGVLGGIARPVCVGDGSHTACPCANSGSSGNGCENSAGTGGGHLASAGNPQYSHDTFVLQASGLPPGSASLYFQGFSVAGGMSGTAFGDGIMCIVNSISRLGVKFNPAGSSQYPQAGDVPLKNQGLLPWYGGQRFYQVWYRDSAVFCTSATYNLTSGIRAVWAP